MYLVVFRRKLFDVHIKELPRTRIVKKNRNSKTNLRMREQLVYKTRNLFVRNKQLN